jgi:hypothetical protein
MRGLAEVLDQGYSGYYNESDDMGAVAVESLGSLAGLGDPSVPVAMAPAPTSGYPVSGDPRQRSTPAQIASDAAALRDLGFPAPTTGNAYDPKFVAEVAAFQKAVAPRAGVVDGLIGPATRSVMAVELEKRRAANHDPFGPPAPPSPPFTPSPAALPLPSSPSPSPIVEPASAKDADDTMLYVGIGAAVLAGLGVVYYATK